MVSISPYMKCCYKGGALINFVNSQISATALIQEWRLLIDHLSYMYKTELHEN